MGVLGTQMPSWRKILTASERRLLAEYLMTLSVRYLEEEPGQPIEISIEPPDDDV